MDSFNRVNKIIVRRNLSRLRFLVQGGFALFCLYAGYRFYFFYLWAVGRCDLYVPRPPSVEGFLPISGLVGLKRLLLTGVYDKIHPAGLTIFLAALIIAFLLRKGFCGWICPVGFTSNLAERIGLKLKSLWRPPLLLDYQLLALKYLLLAFFAFLILFKMDIRALEAFNRSSYNLVVDAKMLLFFIDPSRMTMWVIGFLVIISFFMRNFWCHYLCPYGALLGLLALMSPVRVKRNSEACIDCKKCEKVCPSSIPVASRQSINSPECIGCLECVAVCPPEKCLTLNLPGGRTVNPFLLPGAVLAVFMVCWAVAVLTGHWQNDIPLETLQKFYRMSENLAHP
ncbi:MAG: 4Fe-4S binding protein [Proteobacteria bacterium]|nr:4Fe-4S binding protein [Pseudomonadota bacterium]MBU1715047.1 4Fe-4S binding protein [Pseudomonadota bacterium]